jgi:AP-3 complex subunit sigma
MQSTLQVFVESLDRIFPSVSELDLIFHFPEIHLLLSFMITAGLVLDTSLESIVSTYGQLIKARDGASASSVGVGNLLSGELKGLSGWGLGRRGR